MGLEETIELTREMFRLANERDELLGLLGEARLLLSEFGSCDPYTGQSYGEVAEFLKRTESHVR